MEIKSGYEREEEDERQRRKVETRRRAVNESERIRVGKCERGKILERSMLEEK